MNLPKVKTFLFALCLGSLAMASGGGDPGPRYATYVSYACQDADSPLLVEMNSVTYETEVIPMEDFKISGLKTELSFKQNTSVSQAVNEQFQIYSRRSPTSLSNARFFVQQQGVAGYAFVRDANYQIGIFSNSFGASSRSLQVFVTELSSGKRQTYLGIPCTLKIEYKKVK